MIGPQFWTKSRTRLLRVQQSLADCQYRVVSVPAHAAGSFWAGDYTVPKWSVKHRNPESALAQLLEYVTKHDLEKYEKAASSVGAE